MMQKDQATSHMYFGEYCRTVRGEMFHEKSFTIEIRYHGQEYNEPGLQVQVWTKLAVCGAWESA